MHRCSRDVLPELAKNGRLLLGPQFVICTTLRTGFLTQDSYRRPFGFGIARLQTKRSVMYCLSPPLLYKRRSGSKGWSLCSWEKQHRPIRKRIRLRRHFRRCVIQEATVHPNQISAHISRDSLHRTSFITNVLKTNGHFIAIKNEIHLGHFYHRNEWREREGKRSQCFFQTGQGLLPNCDWEKVTTCKNHPLLSCLKK